MYANNTESPTNLKIKLTKLKFPKNDNLELFLLIGGFEIGRGD